MDDYNATDQEIDKAIDLLGITGVCDYQSLRGHVTNSLNAQKWFVDTHNRHYGIGHGSIIVNADVHNHILDIFQENHHKFYDNLAYHMHKQLVRVIDIANLRQALSISGAMRWEDSQEAPIIFSTTHSFNYKNF